MTAPVSITVHRERFQLHKPFTISRGTRTHAEVLRVVLSDGTHSGHGECVPYPRYGESMDSVNEQIESIAAAISTGMDRQGLQERLPAGAARNAVDCALWDLEAKQRDMPVWQLAQLTEPGTVTTAYSLSLDTPDNMRTAAAAEQHRPLLKIKLGGEGDLERLRAVREGAPESELIIDANEGWRDADYQQLAPLLLDLGVTMVEQPLPADDDAALARLSRPLPVCADEACHTRKSLPALHDRYDMVNVKLDKAGGLTEALALTVAARDAGFSVMVGCMVGTSLAMAPAVLLAQSADVVDLDGPLLLAEDRHPALPVSGSILSPADRTLWG